jgi:2-methylisocitrate lyase-like PEP mutase family enzyme
VSDLAEEVRSLHRPGDPIVLVNVWDAASARVVASAPGCRAIATASWSIAAAHGYEDAEQIPLALMLAAIERVVAAVDLPVTADVEAGYGDSPAQVAETIAAVIAAGAVGVNLEDRLRPVEEHAAVVAAARERGEREGVALVINARPDEFLLGQGRLDEAIARGRAYLEAGADCVFVPGLGALEEIRQLTAELAAPVNVLAGPSSPSLTELAAAGVARVSFGPGSMGVAYAALAQASGELLARGAYPPGLGFRPT